MNLSNLDYSIMPLKKKCKSTPQITLGLSMHRPEMIPLIEEWMHRHDTIFLEEPPESNFRPMLRGEVSIDDYLMTLDLEYPAFSRMMYRLLRELHATGKKIYQIEPFLEVLLSIHELFAEGRTPDDLPRNSLQWPVYRAEREATGALLAYYRVAMQGSFEKTVNAILKFAQADAARFRLRDSLRAQALAPLLKKYRSAYIEAGVIHFQLWRLLRQKLQTPDRVRPVFLADNALKKMKESGQLYGPGDKLTLLYIFHPTIAETEQHRLLAARAIIYSKIIEKQEIVSDRNNFPHLRDELHCIRTTRNLSLQDCRKLFTLIRRAKTSEARQIVADHLYRQTETI